AGGKEASQLAITMLYSLVLHTPDWILSTDSLDTDRMLERAADRYQKIDAALRSQSESDPRLRGMGTTMTLAVSLGSLLILGHVGDSRAYLLRSGKLLQLTRDHNLVQALLAAGHITPEQAATHPFRHMLTQSLGAGATSMLGDFQRGTLKGNDQLLLC